MPNHRSTELAVQVLLATLEEGLAGGAAEQGQQGTCVPQDARIEGMRHGQHRVAGGRGEQRSALRFHPLGRGPRLALRPVASPARAIRRALKAALGTPLCMPSELGGATGDDGVDALLLSRGDPIELPIGVAREAEDVGDFPPRSVVTWRAGPGMGPAPHGRHRLTPPQHWAGRPDRPAARRGCGPWPSAAG
jgi:hypothetical protein